MFRALYLNVRFFFFFKIGPNLNYDEVVVYNEQAALPSYLIVYSMN